VQGEHFAIGVLQQRWVCTCGWGGGGEGRCWHHEGASAGLKVVGEGGEWGTGCCQGCFVTMPVA
jgi:hypothetical protein